MREIKFDKCGIFCYTFNRRICYERNKVFTMWQDFSQI